MATFSEYTKNRKKKKEDEYTKGQSFADYTATALSDNDIAPVKEELTEKEKKAGGWFDSGAFSDGYQLGDISKTILGTLTDINENVTEAVLDATENLIDTTAYGVGAIGGLFSDDFKDDVGEFIAKDLLHAKEVSEAVVKYGTVEGLLNLAANDGDTESASVLGDKSDGTVQSAAHLVGQAALQYVGVPWYVTAGVNSFGGEIESALNEDATYAEAGISGAVTTGAELLTEKLFGAFKFQGKAADDLVIDNITKNISNKVVKSLVKFGWDATGEGAEEVLSGAISAVGQKLTYADEKEWNELYTSEEAWDSFIGGAVLGGGGSAINITKNASAGRDAVTGLTENEQTVLDKEVERLVAEAEKDGTKLTNKEKNEIYEKVQEDLKKGYISTDTIESVLGGDTYKSYKDTIDSEDAILKEYEELGKKKNATLAEQSRYAELKEKVKEIESNSKRSQLKSQLSEEVYNSLSRQDGKRIQTDDFLIESYNEKARSGQAFNTDLSKYKGKEKDTLQKIMEKGQVNNTRRAHEFWEYAAKVAADRGRGITSTTTEEILKMETEKHGAEYVEKNFKGKIPNGYIMENGDIAINVNSPNARRFILGHEIGHQMETADNYGELKDLLYAYAESKEGKDTFKKRKADIESIYGGIEGADADVELTNDLIGEYLYNDADFVYHLSTKNRNLFRKIWDEVKYLYKMATAGSQEQRDLLRIQKTFEKAYRESAKTESKAKGKTDYSLSLVDPVMPTTEGWQRTHTTEEVKEQFPDLWDVSADESEVRNPTQISGTVRSYRKVYEHLKAEGFDGTILDASSGLGYGTRAGIEEYGFDVEDIEPYPDKSYNPKYTDYSTLDKKYDVVISNAVLNVLPQDQRDALVVKMGEMLNDGGRIFINVRGDDVKNASSKVAINEDLMEYYISQSGSYQKGFTPDELKAYLEDTLGAEFTVEKTRMFGKVSAIVTKNGTTKYSLSPEQQEYFKDSVVRDENGDLKVMYHGTSKGGHTVFDTFGSNYGLFGQGSYFTDDKSVAESYTKKGKGNNPQVYESYLNITNPMDMDAEADIKAWMKAVPDADFSGCVTNEDCYRAMEEYLMDEEYSKWEAAEFATDSIMGMGYDGITHIGGGRFNKADETRHQVYIAFNPEQIKNIDNVNPTDNPDIRYSLSNETDKTYLDAVERGDTDTVQRMVDEAASEAGYKKLFYHGTASGDFTKFASHGKPMWITEHKDYAEVYANTKRGTGYAEDRKVMPLYAKMDNVLDLSQIDTMNRIFQFNAPSESLENLADIVGVNTSELVKICKGTHFEELWELVNTKQFADIARKKGYDAIKENEFGNITYGVLDNTQLKSADAVTYKKNKVIPLSERFNTENDDIRYSLTQDSEGTKLTAEQSDFFKGTKALDRNGNLLKVYHTTNSEFTVFDKSKKGEATGDSNTYLGFFFADDSEYMQNFPEFENGKTEAYYLNMTNPIDMTNISKEAFLDVVEVLGGDVNEAAEIYDQELADERDRATLRGDNNTSLSLIRLLDEMTGDADYRTFIEELKPHYDELMSKGYDGVVNYLDELFGAKEYIVLDSNQAKLATNLKPTADDDVRYSFSSIANSFFGDENMTSDAFVEADYKQTQRYKDYVNQCLNNYRQTRADFDEDVAKKETEAAIEGIVKVAVAAKRAGYDIYDDPTKRSTKDSKKRLLFSSLEPNSDYFTSNDISTICDKRQNFAEIYDDIVRAEEAKGVPQGKRFFDNVDNYFYLHNLMAEKGLTQPCRQCYVESMRKNLAPMASAFLRLVRETNPNNTANDQLYQQTGRNKGNLKTNNAATREWVLEKLAEYDMTADALTIETLTTEDGLAQLKIQAPLIYEAFNSFYGQSKPKMPKAATPFRFGELTALLTDEKGRIKRSLVDKINSTGGFRLQSYSDFQIRNFTDTLQVIFEAGTLGLNGHAYTKVPAFLDATEGTNLKRNISIFMYKDGNEWKLDRNDSFPYTLEEIYDVVNADKSGNTSIIAVSQNEDMSAWIMANDYVGYGIPFHKSGMKMDTVRQTTVKEDGRDIKGYLGTKDHTKQQTEVWAKTTADHKALTKVSKGINIYRFWDFDNKSNLSKSELIEKNVKAYIDACEEMGYLPKFREYVINNGKVLNNVLNYSKEFGFVSPDATIEDISFEYKNYRIPYGYYKFLGDFGMFTPDGKASPHDVLSLNNYDFDKAVDFFSDAETLRRNEILQQFANGEERQKYRDSDLTAEELAEIVKRKRGEIAESVVAKHDTKKSLSLEGDAPISFSDDVPMSDLRIKPTAEDIAPVQEVVAENTTTTEDFAPITEEEANVMQRENLASLDDTDAPPEMDAPYYESEAVAPSDPFAERDIKDVGDRKVKAYMYENPEVKPFFQAEANVMLGELRDTVKGERWYNDELYYETNGEAGFGGTSRHTTADIAYLLDNLGYTYAEIEEGLNAIIEDNGKENNACSKRIEFILNDRLMNGYPDLSGYDIPANQDYINLLNEKQITEYSEEARKKFFESVGASDIAPIATESEIAPTREYEAIKPRPEKLEGEEAQWAKNKMARVDKAPTEEQQTAQILAEEPETAKKKSRGWSKFKANFLDKGAVFEDLSLKTKNRKLMAKWNHTLSSESRAQWMIGKGRNGVKSLNAIREEVEKTGLTKQFYEYLYHKHNIDRMNLENRYEDVENKPVFGYDVTAEKSQEIVNQYEFAEPKFKEYAKDVYDYMNYLRKQLVDNGVISQETADLWAEMYPHYVPIRRVGDSGLNINVPLDTGRTGVNAPIKKATGGSRDILPLFDTMAMRTEQTFKAIARNSFGVELKNTLGRGVVKNKANFEEVVDSIEKQEELLQKGENGRNPTFTVFENGEKVTFEITEDMYDALKPTGEGLRYTNKVANTVSNVHRGLLTEYNPVFTLTNAIKDVQDVFLNSKHATKTYANMPRAIKELSTKGKWYTEYMENGGEQNTYFDGKTNTFKAEDNGIKKAIGMPLRAISAVNNFVERAPRLAEYIASRESGASVEEAMLDAARVTTNFAAGGDVTKFLNRNGATFLNASVQGAMQQVRNVREAKAAGLKGWVQLATKFAVVGLGSELLNHLLWEDDEEYEELSDYVKQNYYVVAKYGDGQFVRIPKGRAIAVIQNAFEQVGNALTGDDEVDLKSFLELAVSNLAPNNPVEDNILAPIKDVMTNKTWYGEDLVPTRLQDLPAEEQFDESTDAFSKWLGETTGTSPIKWNYLLNQYSGGIGDVVLPMLTPEAESGDNSIFGNITAPLKDKFTTNSTMNNQNVSDFYDTMDELTINAKASTATDEDVLKYKYFNSVNSELGELYALKREVQNSDLPDDRKYDKVFAIQEQINALAKESLNAYNNVYIEDGYASVGDRYYKQNDDGEWQKITDDQLEKQNDVMDELGISASDYWSNKTEYDFAAKYPEKYSVAKSVGGYDSYKQYMSDLYDIKADKDEYGKSISGSRKEKVIDYINNLDADYGEKIILFKSEYKADDTYNYEIIEYLNGREDISYEEMVAILKELGFTVSSDGNVTWD